MGAAGQDGGGALWKCHPTAGPRCAQCQEDKAIFSPGERLPKIVTVVVSIAARPCWGDDCSSWGRRLPPHDLAGLCSAPQAGNVSCISPECPPGSCPSASPPDCCSCQPGGTPRRWGARGCGWHCRGWGRGEAGPCSAPPPSPALSASLLPSKVQLPRPHVRARSPLQLGRGRLHHLRLPGGSGDPTAACWGARPSSAVPWGGGTLRAGWVAPARSRCVRCPGLCRVARWSAPSPPARRWTAPSTSGTCGPGSAASPAGTPRAPRVSQHGGPCGLGELHAGAHGVGWVFVGIIIGFGTGERARAQQHPRAWRGWRAGCPHPCAHPCPCPHPAVCSPPRLLRG